MIMRKRLFILLSLLVASAPVAFAAAENPFEISLQAGDVVPQDSARLNSSKDSHYFGDGRLTMDVSPYAAVGAEVGWLRFVDRPNGVKLGHLYEVPLMGDLILKYPLAVTDNRLVPYLIGGAGVGLGGYDRFQGLKDAGIKVKPDSEFAWKAGGGLQFFLTRQVAVFAEGAYFDTKFDPKVTGGNIGGKIKLRSILAGGGLTIAF
jgi:opacity protein-like surface antigen